MNEEEKQQESEQPAEKSDDHRRKPRPKEKEWVGTEISPPKGW